MIHYDRLSPIEKRIFLAFRKQAAAGALTIRCACPKGTSPRARLEEAGRVLSAVRYDCPEFFWINYTSHTQLVANADGTTLEFRLNTLLPPSQIPILRAEFDAKVDDICRRAMCHIDVLSREKYLHDFLALGVLYRDADPRVCTAESAINRGFATCEGYSKAFSILANRCDIKTDVVSGITTESAHEKHCWNLVYDSGAPLLVDVTWDSCLTSALSRRFKTPCQRYFNLPLNWANEHKITSISLENCSVIRRN